MIEDFKPNFALLFINLYQYDDNSMHYFNTNKSNFMAM